jgi:hypothetical protein
MPAREGRAPALVCLSVARHPRGNKDAPNARSKLGAGVGILAKQVAQSSVPCGQLGAPLAVARAHFDTNRGRSRSAISCCVRRISCVSAKARDHEEKFETGDFAVEGSQPDHGFRFPWTAYIRIIAYTTQVLIFDAGVLHYPYEKGKSGPARYVCNDTITA